MPATGRVEEPLTKIPGYCHDERVLCLHPLREPAYERSDQAEILSLPHVKLCEMLGLSWSTIPSAFKLPYRKAVMQIHPDKCDDPRATEASQLLNSVYDSVTATGG